MSIGRDSVFFQIMQSTLNRAYPSGLPSNQVITQFAMPEDTVSLPDAVQATLVAQGYPYGWGEMVAQYKQTILSDNPLAYYRLDELSGTTAYDSSGNGNNGTISGSVTFGQPGATFDGDYAMEMNGGEVTTPITVSSSFSVEAWFLEQTNQTGYPRLVANSEVNSTYNGFQLGMNAQGYAVFFTIGTGNSTLKEVDSGSFGIDSWHHVVGTYDALSQSMSLYLDGLLVGTTTGVSMVNASSDISIGGYSGYFADEVAIYSYSLTASQVLTHYNAGKGLFTISEPMSACWTLRLVAQIPSGSSVSLSAAIGIGPMQAIQQIDPAQTLIYADDLFQWSAAIPLGLVGMSPWNTPSGWTDTGAIWMGPIANAQSSAPNGQWLLRKWVWFSSTGLYNFALCGDGLANLYLDGTSLISGAVSTSASKTATQIGAGWHLLSISSLNTGSTPNATGVLLSITDNNGNVIENGSYHPSLGTTWQTAGYINPTCQSVNSVSDLRYAWYVIPASLITSPNVQLQVTATGSPKINGVFWYSVAPWRWDEGGQYDGAAATQTPAQMPPAQIMEVVG